MQEFSSVTASSYDAESLAPMLTEKAQEGWSVVSIVSAGTSVVAYLMRDADAAPADARPDTVAVDTDTDTDDAAADVADDVTTISPTLPDEVSTPEVPEVEASPEAATAVEASGEPAGWGAAPAEPTISEAATAVSDDEDSNLGAVAGAAAVNDAATGEATSAADADATDTAKAATDDAASGVPAGWYADPSGRFELRYWDGNAWTEHVSRAGQQYTDPPVA
jgi:hypothetical protein